MITLVSASMYWGGQRRERAHPEGLSRKLIFLWEEKEEDEELEKEAESHNIAGGWQLGTNRANSAHRFLLAHYR